MKKSKLFVFLMTFGLLISLTACGEMKDATKISLSEETITVDGEAISTDDTAAVYVANDIISSDPVSSSVQTVVHITKPGTYALSGTLTTGQIAVDLGEDAVTDPSAVVTLVLDGVDIACDVAPAIVFYNAYECVPDTLEEGATIDAETAGAKIFIRNKSENYLSGSYVIDEFESALYSAVTLNIDGKNKGELYVNAFTDYGDAIHSDGYLVLNGGTVNAVPRLSRWPPKRWTTIPASWSTTYSTPPTKPTAPRWRTEPRSPWAPKSPLRRETWASSSAAGP